VSSSTRGPEGPDTAGVPEIETNDLRDYAPSSSVDRVWRRLATDLRDDAPNPSEPGRWRRRGFGWGVALAAATFGAGIWVGRQSANGDLRAVALLSPEPKAAAVQGAAAQRGGEAGRGVDGLPIVPPNPTGLLTEEHALSGPESFGGARQVTRRALRGAHDSADVVVPLLPEFDGANGVEVTPAHAEDLAPAPPATPMEGVSPSWQRFANAGEYETALFVLGQSGGFEKALAEATAEQLMLLSDVAWATGQRQRSISALRRVVAEFPSDPVAPLAAWSLGKQLEKVGDKQGALKAFADYSALSPEGDFAEDALVRRMKDAIERGDRPRFKELVTQYQVEFPDGRRSADVARWLSQGSDSALLDAGEALPNAEESEPAPASEQPEPTGKKPESAAAAERSSP
jgi:hypothetical protein